MGLFVGSNEDSWSKNLKLPEANVGKKPQLFCQFIYSSITECLCFLTRGFFMLPSPGVNLKLIVFVTHISKLSM